MIPGEYKGYPLKPVLEQVEILRGLFPELRRVTYDVRVTTPPIPPGQVYEGLLALPHWQLLVAHLPAHQQTYTEACRRVFAVVRSRGMFHRTHEPTERILLQDAQTVAALQKISNRQKGHGIIVFPCQFGLRYPAPTASQARTLMKLGEFGLDVLGVCIMLLTHPERLACVPKQCPVICPGAEFAPDSSRNPTTPAFAFFDGKVSFSPFLFVYDSDNFDSATGFSD